MYPVFRISHPKEAGIFQASKWLSYRVLLDDIEMENLFSTLPPFALYNVSQIVSPNQTTFSHATFLESYASYVQMLKQQTSYEIPKALFSSVMSTTPDAFYAMDIKKGFLLKLLKPVIQLSLHHFTYEPENHSFHFMVHSQKSIRWGLQFSYPQLYSNSLQGDVIEVMKDQTNPNTELFRTLMKWMRNSSRPTSFLINGKKTYITARIGNNCLNWIENYGELKKSGLVVA